MSDRVIRAATAWRHDIAVALSAGAALAVFLVREDQIAGAAGFPLDDSWIHLHFARNLAEGAGFVYNPGSPVAGSTAPLWTLLLAAASVMLGPSLLAAKALGLAAAVAAAVLTRHAAIAWRAHPATALAAAIALACSGPLVWGALSGMEVTLAALLVAAALLAHARDQTACSALAAALAVLARPEALLLVPLFFVARPVNLRRLVVFGFITTMVLAPAVWFSMATVGSPVPATAVAKVEGGLLGWLAGLREPPGQVLVARPWEFVRAWLGWLASVNWLLPLALVPGIWVAWVRHGRALGMLTIALVAHPLAMAWLAPYRNPAFQEGRYSIQLLPIAFVLVALAFGLEGAGGPLQTSPLARGATRADPTSRGGAWRRFLQTSPSARGATRAHPTSRGSAWRRFLQTSPLAHASRAVVWRRAFGVTLVVLALVPLAGAADRYAWAVQNINAMQVHLGQWVKIHVPPSARIALNDIGAIAYFSRRPVIDLMGLVTPDIIPYRRRGESGVIQYVAEHCPDYVIVFPTWFPAMTARTDALDPIYRVQLERNEVAGGPEMVVYRVTRCTI